VIVRWWSRVILTHPRLVLAVAGLVAVASLGGAARYLEIRSSRSELAFSGDRLLQLKAAYREEFGDRDGVVIVVDATNLARAKQFVSTVAARLERDREHVADLFYRVEPAPFEAHALQYLSREELTTLRRKVADHEGLIRDLATSPGLNKLFAGINREMGEAIVGHFFTLEEEKGSAPVDLSFLNTLLRQTRDAMSGRRGFVSPWGDWLGAGKAPVSEGYLLTDDKRYLIVLATIRGVAERTLVPKQAAIERIRTAISEVGRAYPGIQAGVTGSDALASDEIVTAQRDSSLATLLAFTGSLALFLLLWRGWAVPLRAILSLAVGISWTLGFTTLTVGSLNILSAMFVPILIGMGIDYNIYLLERYGEERRAGSGSRDAWERAFRRAGPPTVTGAVTTVAAFYSLILTNFKGLVELGFITGSGLLLCLLAAFTVFPALLILHDGRADVRIVPRPAVFLEVLERCRHHPRVVIALAGLLALASLPAIGTIVMDFNLLELQAEGTESVTWERRLLAEGGSSTLYGVSLARSPQEVAAKKVRLEALPSVDRVQTVFSFLPKEPRRKIVAIRALGPSLAKLPPVFGDLGPIALADLEATWERMRFKLGDRERFSSASDMEIEEARRLLESLRDRLRKGDAGKLSQALAGYQTALFSDFQKKITLLRRNLQSDPMTVADLPRDLKERFVGRQGTYLLKVFPEGNVWAREPLQRFVEEIRSVDPDVIGNPVTAWDHGSTMERGYLRGGAYAAAAMLVVILWSFGSISHLVLALIPLVVGGAWTLGLMVLFRVNFNLANLIILPFIVGYGIINGLQIVKRYQQDGGTGPIIANSTGRAVFLSTTTTIAGFGSLMVANHRGIFSLGFLLSVGVGSVLLASLVVLPALLGVLARVRRGEAAGEAAADAAAVAAVSTGPWHLSQPRGDDQRPQERRPST